MDFLNNSTTRRDVLINENAVDVDSQDSLSRLEAGNDDTTLLLAKVCVNRKLIIGIGMFTLCVGAILGLLVGLLYYSQSRYSSQAISIEKGLRMVQYKAEKSEALLTVVCKAEFGQTSTVCDKLNSHNVS